ncbi:hypothetical protein AX774_g4309, partial [Zancudomyces culisetae]
MSDCLKNPAVASNQH